MTSLNRAIHLCIYAVFVLTPFWLKWSFAPPPFTTLYIWGFIITLPLLLTIILWGVSGFVGWGRWLATRWHAAFAISLLLFTLWIVLSQTWAFGIYDYPGLAQNAALQQMLITGFVLALGALRPSVKPLIGILAVSLVLHSAIGIGQVMMQGSLGLGWLGEFALDPARSGVSVVQFADMRWLRPYGLLPHPNIYAGFLAVGLLATLGDLLQTERWRWPLTGVFVFGFYALLLTFSRGAWLGFAVASLLALPFVWRVTGFWRKVSPALIGAVVVGLIFVGLHADLLLARTGISAENTEMRSIADRIAYLEVARDAVATYPVQGVGAGNFSWYASHYIFYNTRYDLKGNPVHHVYWLVLAELGVIGLALFGLMWIAGVGAALQQITAPRTGLLAAVIALAIIGLVDHYMWTLVAMQALWLGLLALVMAHPSDSR